MSSAIGPGDFVECVRSDPDSLIVVGSVWRCEALIECWPDASCDVCGDTGGVGLLLHAAPDELRAGEAYCPCGFRPIYRPKSEIIDALKQPAPERELEDA